MFTEQDIEFLSKIWKLKDVTRYHGEMWDQYYLERHESVADHTWRMAMIFCYLQDRITLTHSFEKVMKIILIHDIPEIHTWDVPLMHDLRGTSSFENQKSLEEIQAMKEICWDNLEFVELFEEFELLESNEAKIVKYLDKIEWILRVYEYRKGDMTPEHFERSIVRWSEYGGYDVFLDQVRDFLINAVKEAYNWFVTQKK